MALRHFKLTILLACTIFVLSAMPGSKMPNLHFKSSDKVGHLLAYLSLSLVFSAQYSKQLRWSSKKGRWLIKIAIFCVLYGVLLEILQGLVFYQRTFDVVDMAANTAGVGLGIGLFLMCFNLLKRFEKLF